MSFKAVLHCPFEGVLGFRTVWEILDLMQSFIYFFVVCVVKVCLSLSRSLVLLADVNALGPRSGHEGCGDTYSG